MKDFINNNYISVEKATEYCDKDDRVHHLEIDAMKDEPVFEPKLPKSNESWRLPELSYGQNTEVPSVSSAVSINYSNVLGRHLIANRNINTGIFLILVCIFEN